MDYNISLVGNPNVGKTTLYNKITHSFEHVGNWHGVTVEAVTKNILFEHHRLAISDLPGLYSLTVYSPEEGISRDAVINGGQDVVIDVCEVGNLSRNLYLTLQLLEARAPVVITLNMMDELRRRGMTVNYRKLEKALGVPIVPMETKYHSEIHMLLSIAIDYAESRKRSRIKLSYLDTLPLKEIETIIAPNAAAAGVDTRYAAIKLMERDDYISEKLGLSGEQRDAIDAFGDCQEKLAAARYAFIDKLTDGVIIAAARDEHREMHEHEAHDVPLTEAEREVLATTDDIQTIKHIRRHHRIKRDIRLKRRGFAGLDRVFLNRYAALPLFFVVMLSIFVLTFGDYLPGYWMKTGLEWVFDTALSAPVAAGLTSVGAWNWVIGLVTDGIIGGVGGVLVFLPQIVLLFLFLALLEDSGYISRVAFMTDGLFRRIGLSGRSVFTMLMGFGCSATAVLTARGLEDENMRKKTILLTPFMSCSARFPVYSAICAAYFAGGKPFIIFGMYILGAAVAIAFAAIFNKIKSLKSGELSFIMEMPPYRMPTATRVLQILWSNAKAFIVRVGTVVFALNVIVWLLSNFGVGVVDGSWAFGYCGDHAEIRSFLEYFASVVAPVFAPLGFGAGENGWQAVTALISGLVAKEVVLASMESFGGVSAVFGGNAPAALAFVVFTLLYVPCIATLTAVRKETGTKWMLAGAGLQLGTAYVVSLAVYWIGVLFEKNLGAGVSIVVIVVVALVLWAIIAYSRRKRSFACLGCPQSGHCGGCGKGER